MILLSSHTHFEHSNLAKNFVTKIDSRILFLGFEYFNAIYFSDLSIFTLYAFPIEKPLIKTSHRFSEEKSLVTFLLQGIRHLSTLYGNILYKLKTKTLNPYTIDCLRICKQQNCSPSSSHSIRYRLPERLRLLARRHSYGLSCSLPECHQHGERLPCQL